MPIKPIEYLKSIFQNTYFLFFLGLIYCFIESKNSGDLDIFLNASNDIFLEVKKISKFILMRVILLERKLRKQD
jgi:hypothetical protein